MSFRPENEARGGASPRGYPGGAGSAEVVRREGARGARRPARGSPRRGVFTAVAGLLVLTLVVGAVSLWRWYGDQAEGTSVFEDQIAAGPEPTVRLTNEAGQIRVEGVEGLETVEVTAKRYARGSNPAAAKENAAGVAVDMSREGSTLEISANGGRNTGVDYALRVPVGARVEVESAAGDVEVSGLAGDVSALAEAGDVSVRDVRGSVTVEAPSGDVVVEGTRTETGKATLLVGSGDVTFRNLTVGILDARIEAGDVELSGRFSGGGQVFVQTGSIIVRLPFEDTRELDLDARIGEVVREAGAEAGDR